MICTNYNDRLGRHWRTYFIVQFLLPCFLTLITGLKMEPVKEFGCLQVTLKVQSRGRTAFGTHQSSESQSRRRPNGWKFTNFQQPVSPSYAGYRIPLRWTTTVLRVLGYARFLVRPPLKVHGFPDHRICVGLLTLVCPERDRAGDFIKVDPRCLISRGAGLMLRPPEATVRWRLLNGLRVKLLNSRAEGPDQNNLQVLSNAMPSNATDCLIASHFPGEIALITIQTENGLAARPTVKRQLDGSTDTRRSRSSQSVRTAAHPNPTGAQNLVVLTQALVAVGPEVTVTPLSGKGGSVPTPLLAHKRGGSKIGALSLCEGRGPIAVAGCGRIRRMRLNPKQKRVVECTRAVGWTTSVTCLTAGERASRNDSGSLPASVTFIGPGAVYIQTHSLVAIKRLLAPNPHIAGRGGMSGFPRISHVSGTGRGVDVGLSLKRGLAKRVQAGTKKIVLALGLLSLYIMAYSVVTTLLLEGREGLVRVPRHALQVVRSLLSIARRIVIILIRLGREELWVKEAVGQEGTTGNVPKPRENGLAER